MEKSVDAFRTISEVAEEIALPQHVLRFWETRFPQIRPLKRAGGRRYYRPADVVLLKTIRQLLYEEGYTIKGVQKLLKDQGARALRAGVPPPVDLAELDPSRELEPETAAHVADNDVADDDVAAEVAVAERARAAAAAEPEATLPESIRAALDTLGASADAPRFRASDLATIRDSLAVIDECERILANLR